MAEGFAILGGGPAGSAAALVLRSAGQRVVVHEKSRFPRHKVCGEFYTGEILPVLEELGVAGEFLRRGPSRLTHCELHFERALRRFRLPEPAWGLSRRAFDDLMLASALASGAALSPDPPAASHIVAAGRRSAAPRGRRVFAYKAHFSGPASDAVELYFFPGGYCGVNAVEDGATNVCGLAPEYVLRSVGFDPGRLLAGIPKLAARFRSLERRTRWFLAGPLCYGPAPPLGPGALAAGDALCFVDPFTGSGLLAAVRTGSWAAEALLDGPDYPGRCRAFYRRQLSTTPVFRRALALGCAEVLSGLLPGWLLYRLTRPGLR